MSEEFLSLINTGPSDIANIITKDLHNMRMHEVHEEFYQILNLLAQAQMKDEQLLLCSHCNKLFDLDDCVWADLDDTSEGPHFNCRSNGFGHTCPSCEKKSTNKLICYKGNKNKYMDLSCYSAIFGKAVSRTAQTIGWVATSRTKLDIS